MSDKEKKERQVEFSSGFAERREMLKIGFGAICCAGAAQAGWPLFRYMTAPEGGEAQPVPLPKDKLPDGSSVEMLFGQIPVIVIHERGEVYVLSKVCTHLGCLVKWDEAQQRFHCPCHDGYFDRLGNVIGGPPPRPLDRIPFNTTETDYVIGAEPEEAEEKKA